MTKHFLKKPRPSRGRGLRLRLPRTRGSTSAPPPPAELAREESPLEHALGALSDPPDDGPGDEEESGEARASEPPTHTEPEETREDGLSLAPAKTSPPDTPTDSAIEPDDDLSFDEPPPSSRPDLDARHGAEDDEDVEELPPARVPRVPPRRILIGAVVAVGVLAGAVIGNLAVTKLRHQPSTSRTAGIARAADAPNPPAQAGVAMPPPPALAASQTEPAAAPSAEPYAPAAPNDEAEARALREQVLDLLNKRKNAEAIPLARAAIEADPLEALGYLYLGSALQDSGKWKEAMSTYAECVKTATKGIVDECRAMVGRRGADGTAPPKPKIAPKK